ncbi:hypothetical protein [Methylopila sp. Yamaguchi]|uniref:hypothetical protein n=1 Tax=Methylopila sp. Yamaguchi TaxID=1437817 RepID=UPI000CB11D49|nr:hypothetical protein [Methylopila sp. Yamaguchi]GBD49047.1 hypothetical protein METY_2260 [Methylopila sp. Yamaguchi]
MIRAVVFAAFAALASPALALDEPPAAPIPTLAATGSALEAFAPPGWRVETKAEGDLDGDGRPDAAFVLRATDPRNVLKNEGLGSPQLDTNPRILAVALRRPAGYALVTQNATLIPRHVDPVMDDPFGDRELSIERRAVKVGLAVFMSAGGWDMSRIAFTLRLDGEELRLIGYDRSTVARNTGAMQTLSVNYLAGRMSRGKGSIESDAMKTVWSKAARRGPTITQIGDGLEFDPGR